MRADVCVYGGRVKGGPERPLFLRGIGKKDSFKEQGTCDIVIRMTGKV